MPMNEFVQTALQEKAKILRIPSISKYYVDTYNMKETQSAVQDALRS